MSVEPEHHADIFYQCHLAASNIVQSIDTGNVNALVARLDENVTVNMSGTVLTGSEQVGRALVAAHSDVTSMRHMIHNLQVTEAGDQHVAVGYTVLVAQVMSEGSTLSTCDYRDRYIHGADGGLKLQMREVDLIMRFDVRSLL